MAKSVWMVLLFVLALTTTCQAGMPVGSYNDFPDPEAIIAFCVLFSIIGTAIYSRRTYQELVKLNQKIDDFIEKRNS